MPDETIKRDITEHMIEELRDSLEDGLDVDDIFFKKMSLIIALDTHQGVLTINGRLKKVEAASKKWDDFPSLLWLLRFKTKSTVAIILSIFVALSLLYVSGLRVPIFEFLGLPPLLP